MVCGSVPWAIRQVWNLVGARADTQRWPGCSTRRVPRPPLVDIVTVEVAVIWLTVNETAKTFWSPRRPNRVEKRPSSFSVISGFQAGLGSDDVPLLPACVSAEPVGEEADVPPPHPVSSSRASRMAHRAITPLLRPGSPLPSHARQRRARRSVEHSNLRFRLLLRACALLRPGHHRTEAGADRLNLVLGRAAAE